MLSAGPEELSQGCSVTPQRRCVSQQRTPRPPASHSWSAHCHAHLHPGRHAHIRPPPQAARPLWSGPQALGAGVTAAPAARVTCVTCPCPQSATAPGLQTAGTAPAPAPPAEPVIPETWGRGWGGIGYGAGQQPSHMLIAALGTRCCATQVASDADLTQVLAAPLAARPAGGRLLAGARRGARLTISRSGAPSILSSSCCSRSSFSVSTTPGSSATEKRGGVEGRAHGRHNAGPAGAGRVTQPAREPRIHAFSRSGAVAPPFAAM